MVVAVGHGGITVYYITGCLECALSKIMLLLLLVVVVVVVVVV